MYFIQHYDSPLGGIMLASDGEALTGLWFDGQKHFGSTLTGQCAAKALPVFDLARNWLDIYFDGLQPGFTPPLRPGGSAFRKEVLEILLTIPYGTTMTYGEVADRMAERKGRSKSARAVGGAVGHNPISLIIPCHRVVGSDGRLTGYAGGIWRKVRLIELELPILQKKL